MARYYRRRYTKVVKPKKKWATNIRGIEINDTPPDGLTATKIGSYVRLCVNQNQIDDDQPIAPTPTIIKTGNYKVQSDVVVQVTGNTVVSCVGYVLYIPEGVFTPGATPMANYDLLESIVLKHPEWIISWRQFSFDEVGSTASLERVSFSSRLKRNLNSGDEIYFVLLSRVSISGTAGGTITRVKASGMCQFWTCAN